MDNINYDVIIVGAGPSGIFCAYQLIKTKPDLKICIVEKGHGIEKRKCPKREHGKCIKCNPCNITCGFSGAGAFSDGKLTMAISETGGNLSELIGRDKVAELIERMDEIYLQYGADTELKGIDKDDVIKEIRRKAIMNGMTFIASNIRHLGTEKSYEIYQALQKDLINMGVIIKFDTMVEDIIVDEYNRAVGVLINTNTQKVILRGDHIVVGAGREGATWFDNICKLHNINCEAGTVDIGVRVECRNEVMEELNQLYETKLIYHTTDGYDDKVRTFCQNPSGEVALENYTLENGERLITVNGHAYKGADKKTDNTNFALLVSMNFTEPFNEPLKYGKAIASLSNMLAGGGVLVQRYGDFNQKHRRSTPTRISRGNIVPTLKEAVPGDLAAVFPHRIYDDIVRMIEALDEIAPGLASPETLLYGVEVKFYSNKVNIDKNCETSMKNLYAIGDSSSWTRGLSLASGMGLYVADKLIENFYKNL